jgi:hypothetical protein
LFLFKFILSKFSNNIGLNSLGLFHFGNLILVCGNLLLNCKELGLTLLFNQSVLLVLSNFVGNLLLDGSEFLFTLRLKELVLLCNLGNLLLNGSEFLLTLSLEE